MSTENAHRHVDLALGGLLVLLVFAVFGRAVCFDFVNFDDDVYVTANRNVRAGVTLQGITWAFLTCHGANWHPLTWLSHMLDCEWFGLNPAGHHFSGLVLHAANVALLFFVLKRMTRARWPSAVVAALFAVHPLRVESVVWVSERKDVLSGLFWMLTLWAYARYVARPALLPYAITLGVFAAGLLAKPMLVTLPCALLLLDYWPLERWRGLRRGGWRLFWEKAPMFALAAVSCAATILAQNRGGAVRAIQSIPIPWRLTNALVSFVAYVWKSLWPAHLAVFYPHPGSTLKTWEVAGAGLAIGCVTLLAVHGRRRYAYAFMGWLWYLGTLLPVIGIIQVGSQAMADRYTYLPQIGLLIAGVWGVAAFTSKWRHRRAIRCVLAATCLTTLIFFTWFQVGHWRSSVALFEHALRVTANNPVAHNCLGAALYNQGDIEKAVTHYRAALRIKPDHVKAMTNLGVALAAQGRPGEALSLFNKALEIDPDSAEAHYNLGIALLGLRRDDEAARHLRAVLAARPDDASALNNLGVALARQGDLDGAIARYHQALELDPGFTLAHINLANALFNRGAIAKAIERYTVSLRLDPNNVDAHYNLGVALEKSGRIQDARSHWEEALRLDADHVAARAAIEGLQTARSRNQDNN